jgi:hypothetical protein
MPSIKLPRKGTKLIMAGGVQVVFQGKDPSRPGFVLIAAADDANHNSSIGEDDFLAAMESGFYRVDTDG